MSAFARGKDDEVVRIPHRDAAKESSAGPSLALGYLAALPLFLSYELGLVLLDGTASRSSSERVVARLLFLFERFLFEGALQWARIALLFAAAVWACVLLRRRPARGVAEERGPSLARVVAEGIAAGILLGPLLALLQAWLSAEALEIAPPAPRSLAASLRLAGSAPWEELLFRVGLYGGLFLLVRRSAGFLGVASQAAELAAELLALLGSALLFSCFHLEAFQRLLGASGEPFDRGLFLWRLSAGILLGGLFRWRGFGVAAWAHAVFNFGVALGLLA